MIYAAYVTGWNTALEKLADASKEEIRGVLKKHELRETPAQEEEESEDEQKIEREAGVEKKAWEDMLPGGKADRRVPGEFNPRELRLGRKHEHEHTRSNHLAEEIAMDHLTEDPRYYDHLDAMENRVKTARELSSKARDNLDDGAFVFPKERKFPIHDLAHARNALARAHFASDPSRVRSAVYSRYPELRKD